MAKISPQGTSVHAAPRRLPMRSQPPQNIVTGAGVQHVRLPRHPTFTRHELPATGGNSQALPRQHDGASASPSSNLGISRRTALLGSLVSLTSAATLQTPRASHAALVRFPANQLNNRYFLARAGESYSESFGEPLTNPVWKTSERHGLSELGKEQVLLGLIPDLERLGACSDGCWLWPSITQNAYQTAEVVAYQLGIGRSRIVPEYSFLDARGVGALENLRLDAARQAVAEGDLLDADWRPQRGTDGTPDESASDVMVRMRQVLSITETQYFGDDIVFVAPDSDCLSVLQAAVLGVDLRQHRRFAFRPGEVRPLQLAAESFDARPISFACRDPPKCTR